MKETIEEAAERFYFEQSESYENAIEPIFDYSRYLVTGFIDGAKWQAERMYSEANKIISFLDNEYKLGISDKQTIERLKWYFETYFEQFKKK